MTTFRLFAHSVSPFIVPGMLLVACFTLAGCGSGNDAANSGAKQFRVASEDQDSKDETKLAAANKNSTPPAVPLVAEAENSSAAYSGAKTPVGSKKNEAATTPPADGQVAADKQDASPAEGKTDDTKIPDFYVKKLKEIDSLSLEKIKPRGSTQQQQMEFLARAVQTRLELANELVLDRAAPEIVRNEALLVRVTCLAMLIDPSSPETKAAFVAAANDLAASKDPQYAATGKVQIFRLDCIEIMQLKPENGKEIIKAIARLLEQIGQQSIGFEATVGIVQLLQEEGWSNDVLTALETITKHYDKNTDTQIMLQNSSLKLNMLILRTQLNSGKDAEPAGRAELYRLIADQLAQLITLSQGSRQVLNLVMQTTQELEHEGQAKESLACLLAAKSAYEKFGDEQVNEALEKMADSATKRAGLIGSEIAIEGSLLDGEKFDWSKYKGKVVLIDFWATWCKPCLAEIPNIERNFHAYREQGFEVVGVSMDDSVDDVKSFLDKQPLPWPTVFNSQDGTGFDSPLAKKFGISAIPFVVLVGRDGKVDGIHVRGEKLDKRLAELFGKAAAPGDENAKAPATGRAVDTRDNPLR